MADVEFVQMGYFDDRLHIVVIQAVPGINLQPLRMGVLRRGAYAFQFMLAFRHTVRICIFAGVQFHRRCGAPHRSALRPGR